MVVGESQAQRTRLLIALGVFYLYVNCRSILLQIQTLSEETPASHEPARFGLRGSTFSRDVPTILFVIDTTEKNYKTRVRDIRATYMQRVLSKRSLDLIFVGSTATDGSPDMVASSCKMGYWEDSCKRADMMTAAFDWMEAPGHTAFEWVFFADDDAYLLPDNIQRLILALGEGADSREAVWGIPACVHEKCSGFCGGGGYFTNRKTLTKIVLGRNSTWFGSLRDETDKFDAECGRCGDLTIARVIRDHRQIELVHYAAGSYVWDFPDGDEGLLRSLNTTDPLPFLYHYPAQNRFAFVHQKVIELGSNRELVDNPL